MNSTLMCWLLQLIGNELKMKVIYVDSLPDGTDEDIVALEKIKAAGTEELISFMSKDMDKICGHPPEGYEDYISNHDAMTTKELEVSLP